MRPTRTAAYSAFQVVPNIKGKMEAQSSVPLLSLHELLWESFTFTLLRQLCYLVYLMCA